MKGYLKISADDANGVCEIATEIRLEKVNFENKIQLLDAFATALEIDNDELLLLAIFDGIVQDGKTVMSIDSGLINRMKNGDFSLEQDEQDTEQDAD